MKRFITVVLVVALMAVVAMAPAFAATGTVKGRDAQEGTALPQVVCDTAADGSAAIGWRNGECWFFHPGV